MYRENARKRRNIFVRAIIWPISIFLVGRFKGHLSQIILNLELIMINSAEYSREFFLGSRFCKWLLTKHDLAAKQQEKTFWKNAGCLPHFPFIWEKGATAKRDFSIVRKIMTFSMKLPIHSIKFIWNFWNFEIILKYVIGNWNMLPQEQIGFVKTAQKCVKLFTYTRGRKFPRIEQRQAATFKLLT